MLNDIFSLLVALWAVNVAKNRDADAKYTYGWKRAEILGALINAVFLIALCFSILIEALQRLIEPPAIENPRLVLYVGCAGLVSNMVGLVLFHEHGHGHGHSHSGIEDLESGGQIHEESHSHAHSHDHSHSHSPTPGISISDEDLTGVMPNAVVERLASESTSLLNNNDKKHTSQQQSPTRKQKGKQTHRSLNMHGVFLHVMGDALGNIGVILAALIIWKTDYSWRFYTDPVVSLVITLIIFSSALPLSRKASRILLQGTPSNISADDLQREILAVPGVMAVHDFHIWNLTESIFIASIHVQIDCAPDKFIESAKLIRNIFHDHGIHSATVQPEFISGDVSSDLRQRFSRIAGGRNDFASSSSVGSSASDNVNTRPSAYGATTSDSHCLIDEAVNCNTANCLSK